MTRIWTRKELGLLGGILLIAAALRLWGIGYDLPYVFHPDEPAVIGVALRIFKTGDLNPHFFHYPSLVFYVHALAYLLYYQIGRFSAAFTSPLDLADLESIVMGTTTAPDPAIVLIGRVLTVVLGVGCVLLVYLIGRRLTDDWPAGAVAALFVAISPTHIYHSRLVTPDMFVTFFALATLYFAALILREGKAWQYVASGIAIGLTAAGKYNGALIGITLPVAHFLRVGLPGWKDARLYLAAGLSGLVFLLTSPYVVLDYPAFSEALAFDAAHYATGHSGMEGESLRWYVTFLWTTTTIAPLLALAQIVRGALQKSEVTLLLASFPVVYFIFISRFVVRNDRTILPILPFIFLLAAILLVDLARAARHVEAAGPRRAAVAALLLIGVVLLALPVRSSVAENIRRNGEHSKPAATVWIAANIPPGSRLALESYAPYIDPDRYNIETFNQMIDHPAAWYAEQGFDYLVFSKGMYGRYYRNPELYADEIARYEELFGRFQPLKTFTSDTAEIRIYRSGD